MEITAQSQLAETVNTACYLQNRTSTCRNAHNQRLYGKIHGKKPELSRLRVFGCRAYVHITKNHQDEKFGPRAEKRIMAGCGKEKSYRFVRRKNKKVMLSQDLTFDEFFTSPNEALHKNEPLNEIELDELETEFMGKNSNTVHSPETDENNEQEPKAEINHHMFSPISNQDINSRQDTYSSIKTVIEIQVLIILLIVRIKEDLHVLQLGSSRHDVDLIRIIPH